MNGVARKVALVSAVFVALVWAAQAYAVTPPIGYADYFSGDGITEAARKDPTKALAYDDAYDDKALADGSYNFVSLGFGGSIILKVLDGYTITNTNGDGYDFKLFETTYDKNADLWENYKETAHVYAYKGQYDPNGSDWFDLGLAYQDGEFDLGTLLFTTAIKIVDVSRENGFTGTGDGYDLDGMVIRNVGNPVPVPGAALLLGSALLGVVGIRRTRTV